jgi:hypothetical protein
MVVLLGLFPKVSETAQGQEKISGLFQVFVKSKNPKLLPDQKTILAVDQIHDKIFVVNLHYPKSLLVGSRRDKQIELPFIAFMANGKAIRVTLKGVLVDKMLEGSIDHKEVTGWWTGKSASTAWYCGNHNPAHVAFALDEIAECTKKYGCKGWRQVSASEVAAFIKSKGKKAIPPR